MAKAGETQDRCTQYALDVVSGKITAGEYVRLACQRHLDDIEKSKAAPYKYYFDVEKSEEIINFAEELTIAEGEENEHVTAYPFQCFILGSLNGWRTKEKSYRRFRTSYVQLGRQNGKSFINGILACYYGNFDGYKYGKIFCTATKQDQANIVFDEVAKFINSDEDLSEWFKVHDHNHTIDCLLTHSEIKALSGDTKSLDGHRAYLGIVDEYHAHKTNQMYKLLEGGIKKLKSALISVITTAGFDLKSPCYKLYEYCCNLLKGVFENDSQFVYIAQMDEHDDRYVASMAKAAAVNNKIGYDQSERYTFWEHLKASNYDPAQITIACEADCSSGVAAIVKGAGYRLGNEKMKNVSIYLYAGNMRAGLKAAGFEVLTDSKYLTSDAYLLEGDILLNDNAHVATNLTDGAKSSGTGASNTTTVKSNAKVDVAHGFNKSLAGTYKVTASGLNLRAGAGTGKSILAVMKNGEKVQCYGYYNDCNGVKWLYVVYKNIVGYASSKYLSK